MQSQMKPVNVMTDAELTHYIEQFEADLKVLQLEQEYRHKQAEAKALEAYWVANPQLVRLEVGDKLLVTVDKPHHNLWMGEETIVIGFIPNYDLPLVKVEAADGQWVESMGIACEYRRAYLETVKG